MTRSGCTQTISTIKFLNPLANAWFTPWWRAFDKTLQGRAKVYRYVVRKRKTIMKRQKYGSRAFSLQDQEDDWDPCNTAPVKCRRKKISPFGLTLFRSSKSNSWMCVAHRTSLERRLSQPILASFSHEASVNTPTANVDAVFLQNGGHLKVEDCPRKATTWAKSKVARILI